MRFSMSFVYLSITIIATSNFSLCANAQVPGADGPSHADALNQIRRLVSLGESIPLVNSKPVWSTNNYKYVRGYPGGQDRYSVEATWVRVFNVGLDDIANSTIDKTPNPNNVSGMATVAVLALSYGNFSAEDSVDEAQSFRFVKTANGWSLEDSVGDIAITSWHFKPKTAPSADNIVQLTGESPQPFKPNAVLNRAYPWKEGCMAAAGTRVMDLGVDKAQPDFRSVVMDPAVCIPKSHFATASIVPPDALESIQQWDEHPIAASNPPAPNAPTTQVPRASPVAPIVQPFVANAVLNRDYEFGVCLLPRGTRIKDLGHSKTLPASVQIDDVETDPTVCTPKRGSGEFIYVPKSAIQPLE